MDQQRDDLIYRKINQLAAFIIAIGSVVTLLLAIVTIVLHGQIRQLSRSIDSLRQEMAALERADTPPPVARSVESTFRANDSDVNPGPAQPVDHRAGQSRQSVADQTTHDKEAAAAGPEPVELSNNKAALREAKQNPAQAAAAAARLAAIAMNSGDWETAAAELDFCDTADADFLECARLRAYFEFEQQRYDACIIAAERFLQASPSDADVGLLIGRAYLSAGRHEEAAEALRRVSEIEPDAAEVWYHWGMALLEGMEFADASERFEHALAIEPGLAQAWHRLGVARANLGDHDAAIAAFDRAVAQQPDYAAAWFAKAVCQVQNGDRSAAAEAYRQAVDLDAELAETGKLVPGLVELIGSKRGSEAK